MAIKSFSFWLVIALVVSSCGQTQKKETPIDKILTPPTAGTPQQQAPQIPTTLPPGENVKVGLILGPGGMKTWAHLGVLREFEKAGIPIRAVVGLEWGALVAAAYSVKGKTHDAEWQLMKLKKNDLPDRGLLSSEIEPSSIRTLNSYLTGIFANRPAESTEVPFACPSLFLENGKVAWWDRGLFTQVLAKCIPIPPMYEANGSWVAGAFRVEEAAAKLREKGANVIVLVNVLARGQILKGRKVKGEAAVQALWWDGVHHLQDGSKSVDWVVGIHTRNYDMLDFDARQSLVLFGQEFGAPAAKRIADTYGF
jgi:NTE family protein